MAAAVGAVADVESGYSEMVEKEVPLYYGKEGPHPLYQRQHLLTPLAPKLESLHCDTSNLDFWFGL